MEKIVQNNKQKISDGCYLKVPHGNIRGTKEEKSKVKMYRILRDRSKRIGGGGVGRSREGVGHHFLNPRKVSVV